MNRVAEVLGWGLLPLMSRSPEIWAWETGEGLGRSPRADAGIWSWNYSAVRKTDVPGDDDQCDESQGDPKGVRKIFFLLGLKELIRLCILLRHEKYSLGEGVIGEGLEGLPGWYMNMAIDVPASGGGDVW